ncbi:hypothetical protein KSP39_PZI013862 [Platanthera zijinensis]|uniref:Uncharacterized protein n=1 Tax=Platanthera zijinensis TaxID=2320716 RepID=A0AAP0BCB8_9ASPA
MHPYAFHIALAAFAGAAVAAFSSCYFHCRALSQLLEFHLALDRRREERQADTHSGPGDGEGNQRRRPPSHRRRRRATSTMECPIPEPENRFPGEWDQDVGNMGRGCSSRIESRPPNGTYEALHVSPDSSSD